MEITPTTEKHILSFYCPETKKYEVFSYADNVKVEGETISFIDLKSEIRYTRHVRNLQ